MGKITVVNNVSLDGVMQAPARPDEDTRGGFTHGGWAIPYQDSIIAKKMGEMMASGNGSLIRRNLIDEYILLIFPIALGTGRRLFPEGESVRLRLVDSLTSTTGVIIATYQAA